MNTELPVEQSADPTLTQAPFSSTTRRRGLYLRRQYDTLGISWLHGLFQAAIFRRDEFKRAWTSATPVRTIEEFEAALDEALVALRFGGTEVSLLLENDAFVHQAEQAPAFSDSASRSYLRGRVERYEQEHGPVLWISQRTVSTRKEATFLLHLLPSSFYGRINGLLLARRLDLTRIVPLVVPLQVALQSLAPKKDQPVLIAADTGDATTVMVGRADGELLFTRTMLARWDSDPARIGVEVNRSVLYAKQQYTAAIDSIWLLGSASDLARTEVQTRCGAGKEVVAHAHTPVDWLQIVAKLPPRHPVNLVAGYLGRKRRQQFIRRLLVAGTWLTLVLLGLDTWTRVYNWRDEQERFSQLQNSQPALLAERDHLRTRNSELQRLRQFVQQTAEDRLPPVPPKFITFLASSLPAEARLSDLSIKWDTTSGKWTFRIEGQVEADEDTGREILGTFQKQLVRSPLHVHFNDSGRSIVAVPGAGLEASAVQRFGLEGTLFE